MKDLLFCIVICIFVLLLCLLVCECFGVVCWWVFVIF